MERVHDSARKRNTKVAAQRRSGADRRKFEDVRDDLATHISTDRRLAQYVKHVAARAIYRYLSRDAYKADGTLVMWPSTRTLAAICGISPGHAVRALDALIKNGHATTAAMPASGDRRGRPSRALTFPLPPIENLTRPEGVKIGNEFDSSRRSQNEGEFDSSWRSQNEGEFDSPANEFDSSSRVRLLKTPEKTPEEDAANAATPSVKGAQDNGHAGATESPATEESDYFGRGKKVLGKTAGGLLVKLLKAKGGNVALARVALEMANTKQDAREYVARIIHGRELDNEPSPYADTKYHNPLRGGPNRVIL